MGLLCLTLLLKTIPNTPLGAGCKRGGRFLMLGQISPPATSLDKALTQQIRVM